MKKMKHIVLSFNGYGHYKITATYRGKEITTVTSDMRAIDNYKCDEDERDNRNRKRKLQGYKTLMGYIREAYERRK